MRLDLGLGLGEKVSNTGFTVRARPTVRLRVRATVRVKVTLTVRVTVTVTATVRVRLEFGYNQGFVPLNEDGVEVEVFQG